MLHDFNILGEIVPTMKKTAEDSVFATKKTGLEVNVDKIMYMVMYRDQNAEQE